MPKQEPVPHFKHLTDVNLEADAPPVRWRELIGLILIVVLCDLTIYRGKGFAGFAALFAGVPVFLIVGAARLRFNVSCWVLAPMLLLLSARMLWCESALATAVGFALLVCWAMGLTGQRPYLLEAVVFASHTIHAGFRGVMVYGQWLVRSAPVIGRTRMSRAGWLARVLPCTTPSVTRRESDGGKEGTRLCRFRKPRL